MTTAAALAEAWHLDGFYERSARLWASILDRHPTADGYLKVATALLSRGDVSGTAWLRKAAEAGADHHELHFARGRVEAEFGRPHKALDEFRRACIGNARGRARALSAAGFVLWRHGAKSDAQQFFEEARRLDSTSVEVLINTVSAGLVDTVDAAERLLADAIALDPNRYEPFVLLARVAKSSGNADRAADLYARAAIRRRRLGPVSAYVPRDRAPAVLNCTVTGTLDGRAATLRVEITGALLDKVQSFAVNRGYTRICVNGERTQPKQNHGSGEPTVEVTVEDSVVSKGKLVVELEGAPTPPLVALGAERVEFGEGSGWLPMLEPRIPARWSLDISVPATMRAFTSTHATTNEPPALLCVRRPSNPLASELDGIAVYGEATPEAKFVAAGVRRLKAGIEAWRNLLGVVPVPEIVVVDIGKSAHCYVRPAYIRVASGTFASPTSSGHMTHEAGHLWWGNSAGFTPDCRWLGEALAEYGNHMAGSPAGNLGYRRATLEAVNRREYRDLATLGLDALSKSDSVAARFLLRAKGGFVISMLREVMGADALAEFLRAAYDEACASEIDSYTFFALASHVHGANLRWFSNQWIQADAGMTASWAIAASEQGSQEVSVALRGVAAPGAPVAIRLTFDDGSTQILHRSLDAGTSVMTVQGDRTVIGVDIDPDARWYWLFSDAAGMEVHAGVNVSTTGDA